MDNKNKKVRHILQFEGQTANGNSKFRVTTVSKYSKETNSSASTFESWDGYNKDHVFKNFRTRIPKKTYGLIVYEMESRIVDRLKQVYGEFTEIYRI